jgi:hypothetical protein
VGFQAIKKPQLIAASLDFTESYISVSVSLWTVLVTVTLSLAPAVVLLLPPLNKATNNKINTAAPITHTHGEVQKSVCSVVVIVVFVLDVELLEPSVS